MAVVGDNEAKVAVRIALGSDGRSLEVLPPPTVASVFIFLPLLRTGSIGLPAAYHSQSFRPNEDRDGPILEVGTGEHSVKNKELFGRCASMLVELFKRFIEFGWRRLDRALQIHPPELLAGGWLEDFEWYRGYLRQLLTSLAELDLVQRESDEPIRLASAMIPKTDERLPWRTTFEFAAELMGDSRPSLAVSESCSSMVDGWIRVFEGATHRPFVVLDSTFLVRTVRELGDLKTLWNGLHASQPYDEQATLDWLSRLVEAIPETSRQLTFDGLLPNQKGVFRPHNALSRDAGIDEGLKNAYDDLVAESESIRNELLHVGLRGVDALVGREIQLKDFLPRLINLLKQRAAEPAAATDTKLRAACLAAFRWLVKNRQWAEFCDSLPVFTYGRDGDGTISKTSATAPFLLTPKTLWPEPAREFWDAFPPRWVLVGTYAEVLDAGDWAAAVDRGVIVNDLVSSTEFEVSDTILEEYALNDLSEGVEHSIKGQPARIVVGVLAQLKREEFYNSLRSNGQRSARFLRFVLQYVASVDSSWQRRTIVECECGSKHTIIPCEWLNSIRHNR
jgi:hypothetical protein